MKKIGEIPPAWGTAGDEWGDPTPVFTASREGLLYLKEKIDEALQKGEAGIGGETRFDFEKIVVSDTHPTLPKLKPSSIANRFTRYIFLALIVIAIGLALYGAQTFFKDLTR